MDEKKPTYRIYEHRGDTSIFIDVEIDENGSVVFSGQDVGEAPMKFYGDSDYEYWYIVPPDQKDNLLLSLIEKVFGGNPDAFNMFSEFLIEHGIKYEYGSYA